MTPLDAALKLTAAGFSVISVRADGSKAPAVPSWKEFQQRIAAEGELREMFSNGAGIAVIGGEVSGGLEILDAENGAPWAEFEELVREQDPGLWDRLPRVDTPSGGHHLYWRCEEIAGNQKLAMARGEDGTMKVLFETRGRGGYVLAPSSPASCHAAGRPYVLARGKLTETPTITVEQRDLLLTAARSFNQIIKQYQEPKNVSSHGNGVRPGDVYAQTVSWPEILEPYGWKQAGSRGEVTRWRRPGKDGPGPSATTGYGETDMLYVFSTNALPFEDRTSYSKFGAYTLLNHNGDFAAATRALAAAGFEGGNAPEKPEPRRPDAAIEAERLPAVLKPLAEPAEDPEAAALALVMHSPTQDNVGLLFQRQYGELFRYCDAWGVWLVWDGARWKPERTGLAMDYSRLLARTVNPRGKASIAAAGFARGVEAFAQRARCFATESKQWDQHGFLLNTPTGAIALGGSFQGGEI